MNESKANIDCPFCDSKSIRVGHLSREGECDVSFTPKGLKIFALTASPNYVRIENEAFICEVCGMVWTKTNPLDLKEVLTKWEKKQNTDEPIQHT